MTNGSVSWITVSDLTFSSESDISSLNALENKTRSKINEENILSILISCFFFQF